MDSIVVNADLDGKQISRDIYGHFSEHLGRCIYGGFWVGKDSNIPNINGYRKDVVEAFKELEIPNLRWPGGCFADEYHWRDGIGPYETRKRMINTHWGGVVEDNSFGTHEFFGLCELLGCKPYVNGNVGSGTVQEMSEWIEYMTFSGIGKEINRSPARVGQILTKALRKLSHPTRAVYYKEGFDVVEDRLRQEEERIRNQKATVNPDMGPFEIREALGQLAELSIYEMKLSVRSCNCLARAGIKDLYSLVITVYEDEKRFRDIRNLGRLSIKEILKRLMKIGIAIPESYKDYIEL